MNINLSILRDTHERDVITPPLILINRSNAKELKNSNIIYLNGQKSGLNLSRGGTAEILLNQIQKDLELKSKYRVHPANVQSAYSKLLTAIFYNYKATVIVYRTGSYYNKYPSQIVGFQFTDKKYMTMFLLKYGHFIC